MIDLGVVIRLHLCHEGQIGEGLDQAIAAFSWLEFLNTKEKSRNSKNCFCFLVRVSRFVCIFSCGENNGVAAYSMAASDCPLDSRIEWFESPHTKEKSRNSKYCFCFLVRVSRFELEAS